MWTASIHHTCSCRPREHVFQGSRRECVAYEVALGLLPCPHCLARAMRGRTFQEILDALQEFEPRLRSLRAALSRLEKDRSVALAG